MPIYEFECTGCPSRFELKRGFHDQTPVSCPACGRKARRRFSSVPIIFKGSGFYVTDSKGSQSATTTSNTAIDEKPGDERPKAPADSGKDSGEGRKAPAEASKGPAAAAKSPAAKEKVATAKDTD